MEVVAWDEANDLGLLKSVKPFKHIATLRTGKNLAVGESISTYGYPLFGELSDSAKITQGNINSLAGIGNVMGEAKYALHYNSSVNLTFVHLTFNQVVAGSIPTRPTNKSKA